MTRQKKTKYALLGWLATCPATGYELKKNIEHSTDFFWSESFGQIYPELEELAGRGLVTVKAETGRLGAEKKVYTITELGLGELREWLAGPTADDQLRSEYLLKLFFGGFAGVQAARKQIVERLAATVREGETLRGIVSELSGAHKDNPHLPYWLATARCGISYSEAHAAYLRELLTQIDGGWFVAENTKTQTTNDKKADF